MKECLSDEILQLYFDGELTGERMEAAALHLAGCQTCAASFRELERESSLVFSALAPEFEVPVPTERLHRRIDAAIVGLQVVNPVLSQPASRWRGWMESISALLTLTPQRTFGYAGLALVLLFAVVLGISQLRPAPVKQPQIVIAAVPQPPKTSSSPANVPSPVTTTSVNKQVATVPNSLRKPSRITRSTAPRPEPATSTVAQVKLIPGERSYLKTIAALDNTIKSGNKAMRPSLQAEYERNLALVDRAIAATRSAAKRNPNDPDAADFMFSAYQSKVDLLNTIADARVYNRPR